MKSFKGGEEFVLAIRATLDKVCRPRAAAMPNATRGALAGIWRYGQKRSGSCESQIYDSCILCFPSESAVLTHRQERVGLQSPSMGAIRNDLDFLHIPNLIRSRAT